MFFLALPLFVVAYFCLYDSIENSSRRSVGCTTNSGLKIVVPVASTNHSIIVCP